MKDDRKKRPAVIGEKGVTAVLAAILIVMLLGFAALAIDIGYGMVTKNELQNIADAAALAATRQLSMMYQNMSAEAQHNFIPAADNTCSSVYPTCAGSADCADCIMMAAINVASQNRAGGRENIVIRDEDIFIGRWNPSLTPDHFWTPDPNKQPLAVRVIARRDSLANTPIVTFFAKIFGIQNLNVTATATAAISGMSHAEPGELELPVGISRYFFDEDACGDHIAFSPSNTPESCAGWTSWTYNANDPILRDILDENLESPETQAYDSIFNFVGGKLSQQTFDAILSLFQRKGYDVTIDDDGVTHPIVGADGKPVTNAGEAGVDLCQNVHYDQNTDPRCSVPCDETNTTRLYYPDGTPRNLHEWPTTVVVYENHDGTADCENPNQDRPIVGFARITMDDICDAPAKIIRAEIQCNFVEPEDNDGGGGPYGDLGPIPGLVE